MDGDCSLLDFVQDSMVNSGIQVRKNYDGSVIFVNLGNSFGQVNSTKHFYSFTVSNMKEEENYDQYNN